MKQPEGTVEGQSVLKADEHIHIAVKPEKENEPKPLSMKEKMMQELRSVCADPFEVSTMYTHEIFEHLLKCVTIKKWEKKDHKPPKVLFDFKQNRERKIAFISFHNP